VDLTLLRIRLHRWLRQPVGVLAVVTLALGLAMASIPRIQVHAHAHGDAHHVTHEHHHDGDTAPGYGDGEHPEGKAVPHVHSTAVAATLIPSMTDVVQVTMVPVAAPLTPPDSVVLPSRPTEHFRPPIV